MIPVVLFVARSETGKTTLIEGVISIMEGKGFTVGTLKHTSHRLKFDSHGTDSMRFIRAGARLTVVSSPDELALVRKTGMEMSLESIVEQYFADVDILLVEGYKAGRHAKIEVFRRDAGESLLCRGDRNDPDLIAVASDAPLELDVPVLPLEDPESVSDFIIQRFLS